MLISDRMWPGVTRHVTFCPTYHYCDNTTTYIYSCVK
jgi:hypothetical protein